MIPLSSCCSRDMLSLRRKYSTAKSSETGERHVLLAHTNTMFIPLGFDQTVTILVSQLNFNGGLTAFDYYNSAYSSCARNVNGYSSSGSALFCYMCVYECAIDQGISSIDRGVKLYIKLILLPSA